MLDRPVEYEKMALVEASHWWYRLLHERVLRGLERSFGARRDIKILDIGCGTGGLMDALRRCGYERTFGLDLSEHAVRYSEGRGFSCKQGDLRDAPKCYEGFQFDAIVLNDVVCYLPLDRWPPILDSYLSLLAPGGIVLINAPAINAFRGNHDRAVGIIHRMYVASIDNLYHQRSYERVSVDYWPFLLSPLVFVARALQRLRMALDKEAEIRSDVEPVHPLVNRFFYWLSALELKIEAKSPWGSSLFIVLRRR